MPTRPWQATSSYDIYMVDTPKENNGEKLIVDNPTNLPNPSEIESIE